MSEVASAPATSQLGRRASARGRRNRLNALEALERGFALFKSTFAWEAWRCYSACQFASLEAREDGSKRHSLRSCIALSSQWFGGGLLLFLMLFPLWIAVWLNGLIVALLVPQLLHSIFGVNTLLSTPMGMFALFRSSAFWLSLFAGAWLALDPIVKCSFVVVYQHLQSRLGGDDLRGLLASLPREQQKKAQMIASTAAGGRVAIGALMVLAAILAGTSPMASACAAQAALTRSTTETPANTVREAEI